jgi:serine/threonine protein kinase
MDDSDFFEDAGYSLQVPLDEDEWGSLYRATYIPHRREVLLRAFPPGLGQEPRAWELMQAEIGAWARLDHPGIVQALDWGEVGGRCFLATSTPRGRQLGELLREDSGLEEADEIFMGLLVSLEAARQWGVIHLGLGPSNIWIAPDGAVQVGEFGFWYVAREFPSLASGTSRFTTPEQASGGRTGAATDVYSLGLIYLALRFGLNAARTAPGASPLPEGLEDRQAAVTCCLEAEPLARFRSAGELARAFGWVPDEWLYEDHRDCPICRLKSEVQRETSGAACTIPSYGRDIGDTWVKYAWALIIALAVATAVVWWLALR